jgi:hypothetical protein
MFAKPKRRWFRFSLRTLFAFTTVVAISCGWFESQVSVVHQRKQLLSKLNSTVNGLPTYETTIMGDKSLVLQGEVATPVEYQLSWIRQALGDKLIPLICLPTNLPSDMIEEFRKTFPESIISQMPPRTSGIIYARPVPGKHFEKHGDKWTTK